jgi:hypothetical protein
MASHYKDPGRKYGRSREKGDVDADMAEKIKQKIITQARAARRQGVPITEDDIARLVAFADLESGFNPDAANKGSDASGVFQIRDGTAEDAFNRLKENPSLIGGYQVKGTYKDYKRFDPDSNIAVGIAVYLDKKRKAKSDDVNEIYKRWNSGAKPAEQKKVRELYEKYKKMKLSLDDSGSDADKIAEATEQETERTAPERQSDDAYSTEDRKRKDIAAGDDAEDETVRRGGDSDRGIPKSWIADAGNVLSDASIGYLQSALHEAGKPKDVEKATDAMKLRKAPAGFPDATLQHALDTLGVKSREVQFTPAEADVENETAASFDIRDNDTSAIIGSCVTTPTGCEITAGDRKVVMDRISGSDVNLETYAKNDDGEYELLGTTRIGDNDGITVTRPFV